MGHQRTNNLPGPRWQSLRAAARRLGRHVGPLRRLCPALADAGLARMVRGGGRKARWEVRQDAELPANELEALGRPRGQKSIVLTVGDTSIRISAAASVTLHISPARTAAGKLSRTPFDGRSTGN